MDTKRTLKKFLPPLLLDAFCKKPTHGFFGFYHSWEDAARASTGWQSENVLEKVCASLLKVRNGNAVYERDSALFDKVQYSWPLLAALQRVALEHDGHLNVADFGGSLGTTYFQNRAFLSSLKSLRWNIIEQKNYVARGKALFENDVLKFYEDIKSCLKTTTPHILIASSVIQYLPQPYEQIRKFIDAGFDYILFDRTSFLENEKDKIAIQKVKPSIYQATFPIWFFNYRKMIETFQSRYNIVAEFDAFVAFRYGVSGIPGGDKGFFLKRRV
ncbi:MAG: Methyltransferase, TIGR04325 family [Candidatus Kaiserbacteria bacterium GW2011_GWA2_49_19]|uniref:Methyltransferase, TIGR04325 family n=1 Tax=Candidatus Kaiserbacteria bacterium GW2011_GWA2_49_19 TaxID=1618669 RepID=A0A0G1VRM8_9BACT|nr:MAG: Methyltransferase, TIGR04325 family [Candidatus Kaiserbacteria bacterium GW2011_GWA2_49_19]